MSEEQDYSSIPHSVSKPIALTTRLTMVGHTPLHKKSKNGTSSGTGRSPGMPNAIFPYKELFRSHSSRPGQQTKQCLYIVKPISRSFFPLQKSLAKVRVRLIAKMKPTLAFAFSLATYASAQSACNSVAAKVPSCAVRRPDF